MYHALSPMVMTAPAACHRCRNPLAAGEHSWQATAAEDDRGWLCLPCGRPLAIGRPGRSAELEAMRRMRAQPIVEVSRPVAPSRVAPARPTPRQVHPMASRRPRSAGPRRWARRLFLSLLIVFVCSPLTAAGPVGRVLAVVIGGPAALLFWVSVLGLLITALRDGWRPHSQPTRGQGAAPPPTLVSAPTDPRPLPAGERVRVGGAEDNWVKGVRGEQAVGAALSGTGLPVLHDRRLREGSDANIDHLLVAADAVYVIDAKNLAGTLTTAGDQLRVDSRDRTKLLDGVRRQAAEVAGALTRMDFPAPVRAVLCLTGTARPSGVQFADDVLLTTPETVAQIVTLPGVLTDDQRSRIADLLAWAFPPAVSP